jgi:hypothetical protein
MLNTTMMRSSLTDEAADTFGSAGDLSKEENRRGGAKTMHVGWVTPAKKETDDPPGADQPESSDGPEQITRSIGHLRSQSLGQSPLKVNSVSAEGDAL